MSSQPHISVCIPCYEMYGKGAQFLKHSLDILTKQTFTDFEVVISDFSKDTVIKELCTAYSPRLTISYHKNTNPIVGMSTNTNNAIEHAQGKIIKLLFQDDFLFNEQALQITADNFNLEQDHWMVTGCEHSHDGKTFYRPWYPRYNRDVLVGNNTIGAPSVLTIKNDSPFLFDPELKWLTDCDYYYRCYNRFGKPKIIRAITAVIRTGDHQITNTEATEALRQKEYEYVINKYNLRNTARERFRAIKNRTHRTVRSFIRKKP